ncbi:MAG TPA: HAMP domain-containing sensor histidine kinase [Candidatus Dormibacteraeota bacterium]|nr:HAMP domain-containing sensor histidine kinase [Candidatus Dormibacteraeota bacterium]
MATGIVAGLYLLISVASVLITTHNLTSAVDDTLSQSLTSLAAEHNGPRPGDGFTGPPGAPRFGAPVLWWMFHPDGNYDNRSADAQNINLPVSYKTITSPQTLEVSGIDLRVRAGLVGDDWAVVGQSMASVSQARSNLIFTEAMIAPVLLLLIFLGSLAIGRRVAAPVEQARQRQMEFTANASHELRTPLSVIQAQTTLALAQPRDDAWYRRAFQGIDQESKRMRGLVDDLLWLARFDATRAAAGAQPVDVAVLAEQAADRFAAIAEARQQRLVVSASTGSHVIAASPEWVDRLLGVLLDNACKYTPEGGSIELHVGADGDRVRVAVDDSGPGVPPEQRRMIFDRFQRATDQAGGSGLGLAIADAVVRGTNGRWEIGTSAAGGASMAVTWPRLLTSRASQPSPATVRPQAEA